MRTISVQNWLSQLKQIATSTELLTRGHCFIIPVWVLTYMKVGPYELAKQNVSAIIENWFPYGCFCLLAGDDCLTNSSRGRRRHLWDIVWISFSSAWNALTSHERSLLQNSRLKVDRHQSWVIWPRQVESVGCYWGLTSRGSFLSLGRGRLLDEFFEGEDRTFVGYRLDIVLISMRGLEQTALKDRNTNENINELKTRCDFLERFAEVLLISIIPAFWDQTFFLPSRFLPGGKTIWLSPSFRRLQFPTVALLCRPEKKVTEFWNRTF